MSSERLFQRKTSLAVAGNAPLDINVVRALIPEEDFSRTGAIGAEATQGVCFNARRGSCKSNTKCDTVVVVEDGEAHPETGTTSWTE